MKYTLKHRLVGAAVLAAVAVLFLPGFFKDKEAYSVDTKSQIPAPPAIASEEFKSPQPVPNIEPAPAPENMFVPPDTAPEQVVSDVVTSPAASAGSVTSSKASSVATAQSSTVAPMPLNAKGLPEAWIVQVGGFTAKEAANKLRDELQADGHKAYVRTTVLEGKSISRVYIGPQLNKAEAQAIKAQMDKRMKTNTMIKPFQP